MTTPWRMLINRADIRSAALERCSPLVPEAGEIVVELRLCGLTANNVTYAALGDGGVGPGIPPYWAFFPSGDARSGLLPVWGYAEVTASACADVAVGEELYGYFPLASHAVLKPEQVATASLVDGRAHRRELPAAYNGYVRADETPLAPGDSRALWVVFRPLLATGFLVADQLLDGGYYGAGQMVIASASSKTAMMTAFCLNAQQDRPKLVGLTSPANEAFLREAALYDEVIGYDQLHLLDPSVRSVFVDMAGNRGLMRQVHDHLGDRLALSLMVGIAHWDAAAGDLPTTGPGVTPFFAPSRIEKRTADWGRQQLAARIATEWNGFVEVATELVDITQSRGAQSALDIYRRLVAGEIDPRQAQVIEF